MNKRKLKKIGKIFIYSLEILLEFLNCKRIRDATTPHVAILEIVVDVLIKASNDEICRVEISFRFFFKLRQYK